MLINVTLFILFLLITWLLFPVDFSCLYWSIENLSVVWSSIIMSIIHEAYIFSLFTCNVSCLTFILHTCMIQCTMPNVPHAVSGVWPLLLRGSNGVLPSRARLGDGHQQKSGLLCWCGGKRSPRWCSLQWIPTNQYIAARHTVIDSLTYSIHGCIPFCFQVLVFMLAEHKLATLLTACFFPASSFLCVCCVTCCRVRYSSHQPPLQRRTQTETTAIFSNWCFK